MAKISRQTARQWIVTHEWMVNPMQQTEWIEGKGLLIWLAEVFSSLGTGLYLVSLFVSNWWGAFVGWLIVVGLKLPLHFIYLGNPWRFWRAMPPFTKAWRTSWIARGTFFSVVFSGLGLCQLATSYFFPGSGIDILAKAGGRIFLRTHRHILRICDELLQKPSLLEYGAFAHRHLECGYRRWAGLVDRPGDDYRRRQFHNRRDGDPDPAPF